MQLFEEWSGKFSDEEELKSDLTKVLEHEMRLMESLKGGEALSTHMEDFYLESLCKIIALGTECSDVEDSLKRVHENLAKWRASVAAAAAEQAPGE